MVRPVATGSGGERQVKWTYDPEKKPKENMAAFLDEALAEECRGLLLE